MNTVIEHRKSDHPLQIGCASGFWGDSQIAVPQLLTAEKLDYIVFDYLAETTMSILQRARMRNPELGYATDFVNAAVKPNLRELMRRGIRLVSNAGGLNPEKCREAILAIAAEQGLTPNIIIVKGDDVLDLTTAFTPFVGSGADAEAAPSVAEIPDDMLSANAYLGAQPIAEALRRGADIVITGRCVDSAVLVGIAAYEYDWKFDDYDRLAQASLAGHLLECGPQTTGGLFTDWETVPDWANIGYPIVSLEDDGSFELYKAPNTGGLITAATASEQLVYEIGDPGAYILPDVICDFRGVEISQIGTDRVAVKGAIGKAPPRNYKVTVTYQQGYQLAIMMAIRGQRALAKAKRTAEALLDRTRRQMQNNNFDDYSNTLVEFLGAESMYGPYSQVQESREIVLRLAVQHEQRKALEYLQKEVASAGISMGPGTRSHFGGRAEVQAVIRTASFYLPKQSVKIVIDDGQNATPFELAATGAEKDVAPHQSDEKRSAGTDQIQVHHDLVKVSLSRLAYARSGDKGNDANIGVIARKPEFLPVLKEQLTTQRVHQYFDHLIDGGVRRFELPGIYAMNFFLTDALAGGGSCSLRSDPLGKSYAQMLLDLEILCPQSLLEQQQ